MQQLICVWISQYAVKANVLTLLESLQFLYYIIILVLITPKIIFSKEKYFSFSIYRLKQRNFYVFVLNSDFLWLGFYYVTKDEHFLKIRASLVAQWLRVCLPVQGTRVRAQVWEDPTCRGATRPVSHNYGACASGACAPQQERPAHRDEEWPPLAATGEDRKSTRLNSSHT